jgi:uncharacterized membrane protein
MKSKVAVLLRQPLWLWVLRFVVVFQLIAMSNAILNYGGSHILKYHTKKVDVEQVQEINAQEALEAIISGRATQADYDHLDNIEPEQPQNKQNTFLLLDQCIGYFFLTLALVASCYFGKNVSVAWVLLLLFALTSLWGIYDSLCALTNGGKAFYQWIPWSVAARSVTPVLFGIALLIFSKKRSNESSENIDQSWFALNAFDFLARISIALTFFAHGYKAWEKHGAFQDLILLSARRVNLSLTTDSIGILSKIIGVQDILLAMLILSIRSKVVMYWIAAWGIITAFSRITALGGEAYNLVLLRAANGGLALSLVCFYVWLTNSHQRKLRLIGTMPLYANK